MAVSELAFAVDVAVLGLGALSAVVALLITVRHFRGDGGEDATKRVGAYLVVTGYAVSTDAHQRFVTTSEAVEVALSVAVLALLLGGLWLLFR